MTTEPVSAWPAGWYPDPDKEAPLRYYNGERWTDRRRDRMPLNGRVILGLGACAGAVAGSVGPWVTLGIFHANGLDNGSDGTISLGLAIVTALALWAAYSNPRGAAGLLVALLGGGILAVAAIDINNITSKSIELFDSTVSPDPGWGIILTAISGGLLVLVGIALLSKPKASTVGS
jgi:hypothetical protein